MTQYLFRGKVIGSDQWVYGNLLQRVDSIGPLSLIEVQDKETFEIATFQVYPESVGMWLFMKDVKGKVVFDGDILSGRFGTGHGGKSTRYKVMNFSIRFHKQFPEFLIDMPKGYGDYRFCPHIEDSEVIGNITDHPHLLNPASGQSGINNMLDPNTQQQPANQESIAEQAAAGQDVQATEQDAQEQALESAEEGTTEG